MTQQFAQVEKFGGVAKSVIVGSGYGTVQTDLSNARGTSCPISRYGENARPKITSVYQAVSLGSEDQVRHVASYRPCHSNVACSETALRLFPRQGASFMDEANRSSTVELLGATWRTWRSHPESGRGASCRAAMTTGVSCTRYSTTSRLAHSSLARNEAFFFGRIG